MDRATTIFQNGLLNQIQRKRGYQIISGFNFPLSNDVFSCLVTIFTQFQTCDPYVHVKNLLSFFTRTGYTGNPNFSLDNLTLLALQKSYLTVLTSSTGSPFGRNLLQKYFQSDSCDSGTFGLFTKFF